ncbi:MAG: Trk family potassium uptake protein [Eubacterium sp.]|nr:Trk family potassium uptake protein [Eubacterium sp.]
MNNNNKSKSKKNYTNSYPRLVALSFIILILVGALLLMLPISVKSGSVSFLDALFTATSASCVTGLVIFDTFTKWTLFGQIVIICLIQIGGLGFITIITLFSRFVKKRFSVHEKILLRESLGSIYTGGTKGLVRVVVGGTAIFELLGAAILSTQFIPQLGIKSGLYTSVFLSISAFCNAGFDIMGRISPGSSLMSVNDNPVIILTIAFLIIAGGIGFLVWDDIVSNRFRAKKYNVHTKLVLVTTAILLVIGTVFFMIFEYSNTLDGMPIWQKILNSFFASSTARTAGFNSVSNASLTAPSRMITDILMLIGGSSGSTAGGIKTTTIAIMFLCVISTFRKKSNVEIFGKRISSDDMMKSAAIVFINVAQIVAGAIVIIIAQPSLELSDVLFECFSAMGTVGMTTGITSSFETIPKIVIILMMFIGRLTSLVFAFTLFYGVKRSSAQKPRGNLLIG